MVKYWTRQSPHFSALRSWRSPKDFRASSRRRPDGVAADPARVVRREEGDDATDIVRLGDALQRLDAERELASRVRLGEVRHVGLHGAWRHRIDADATLAEHGGEVLYQRVDRPLVAA